MAIPLVFVIIVSMIKDAYEDFKRHTNDDKENNSTTLVYDYSKKDFVKKPWKDIWCGDVVKLMSDDEIPSDMVILSSSDEKGNVYVETKNLDGETNLKPKSTSKRLFEHFERYDEQTRSHMEKIAQIDGSINCQPPNN